MQIQVFPVTLDKEFWIYYEHNLDYNKFWKKMSWRIKNYRGKRWYRYFFNNSKNKRKQLQALLRSDFYRSIFLCKKFVSVIF